MRLRNGAPVGEAEAAARTSLLEAGFDIVDYVAARDVESFPSTPDLSRPARILATVRSGVARLIDNMAV